MPHPRFELTSFSSSQFSISSFIHHSTQNPPFPTLIHSLIHTDLTVIDWHRFEPLPEFHVSICLGGAMIVSCNPGGVTGAVLTVNLTFGNLIFISFQDQDYRVQNQDHVHRAQDHGHDCKVQTEIKSKIARFKPETLTKTTLFDMSVYH